MLVETLNRMEHHTYIFTCTPDSFELPHSTYIGYDTEISSLPVIDGVVNLAGESLFGYWTQNKIKAIKKRWNMVFNSTIPYYTKHSNYPNNFLEKNLKKGFPF